MTVNERNAFDVEALSKRIAVELGETYLSSRYQESGSTCAVYKLRTNRSDYALRVATPNNGKEASFESDFRIRKLLWNKKLPVAKPIATHQSFHNPSDKPWALDEWKMGTHPVRGAVFDVVSEQLGRLLRAMHELNASGFGQLKNSGSDFIGVEKTAEAGLLTRYESPWPFSRAPISAHPAIQAKPELLPKILPMKDALVQFVRESHPVLVHTDLHEGQFLIQNNALTALLDFNDVVVGRREWDLGSYWYFHGKACFLTLLEAYSQNINERRMLLDGAMLASVLIALHHGNRGVVLNKPHRIKACYRFLCGVLR